MTVLYVNTNIKKGKINKELYGHFSEHLGRCIYNGIFVGKNSKIPNTNGMRNDVVEALKEMKIPVLRWPGGCFADEYHWQDGIGPLEGRRKMVNTNWGGVVEDNSFGTHEFMELCNQLGCDNYINGNVGSGTVQEMADWIEYMTMPDKSTYSELRKKNGREEPWKINYFGVGNESWGCGGCMRPEFYADEFRRYNTFVRQYQKEKIYRIACGANADDYQWTKTVMEIAAPQMDGISLHYYTIPNDDWSAKGSAVDFDTDTYYITLKKAYKMEELLQRHEAIMDQYDPKKRVGLIIDEWGTWYDVEPGTNPGFLYQQNTMRDAMVAAINLNLFNEHCNRVKMANIAQLVNVLQSVILTEGDKMLKTPTYHVFEMFKNHQDATLIDSQLLCDSIESKKGIFPQITQSVSEDASGNLNLTIANLSAESHCPVTVRIQDKIITKIAGEILQGKIHDMNTFENTNRVHKQRFENFTVDENKICLELPECSVVHLCVK